MASFTFVPVFYIFVRVRLGGEQSFGIFRQFHFKDVKCI